jgi:hypothetical protein
MIKHNFTLSYLKAAHVAIEIAIYEKEGEILPDNIVKGLKAKLGLIKGWHSPFMDLSESDLKKLDYEGLKKFIEKN